ncbi:MAG: PolC-type DNA polymerase III [Eubacteriales bacterium]|nr:PolC-type DNA polymerase III [Eubacteriales bacterium]
MSEKRFTEVFPQLQVSERTERMKEKLAVTRVTLNSSRNLMCVFTLSDTWIHKKHIYELEQAVKEQFFPEEQLQVRIIERFQLSGQYTPENFFPDYRDSILMELKNYSIFEYTLLKGADCSFTAPDEMDLTIEKSVVAQEKAEELIRILEKIFCERCGLSFKIHLHQKEATISKARKNSDLRIEQEIAAITERVAAAEAAENGDEILTAPEEKSEKKQKKAPKEAAAGAEKKEAPVRGTQPAAQGKKGDFRRPLRRSDNPDVIYGRDFEGDAIALSTVEGEIGEIILRGQIRAMDKREIRNEKTILIMEVTDFTDTIVVKMFLNNDQVPELTEHLKKGAFIKLRGVTTIDRFDSQLTIGSVYGIKKSTDFRSVRVDTWPQKRVELHCHTKMSDMDGVTDVKDIVKQAYRWGHPAVAVTDHGVVQSFPDANHAIEAIDDDYRKKYQKEHPDVDPKELKKMHDPFKVIYGVEAYLVDDLRETVTNSKNQKLDGSFVVFDLETTGFSPVRDRIIEIGAVRVENGAITERFSTFVNPKIPIPFRIEELTSINDSMVMDAPVIEDCLPKFLEFAKDAVLVAHNASFDVSFIEENCDRMGIAHDFTSLDTVALARVLLPQLNRYKLDTVAKALQIPLGHHHRAVDDAACTADIFVKFTEMLAAQEVSRTDEINELSRRSDNQIRKMPSYHAIILAKNDIGRVNLYRLVSYSHLKYFSGGSVGRPKLPKSLINQYREGLILGSACEAGELFRAVLEERPEAEIGSIVNFYDYLEVQPIGNNAFMLRQDREDVKTEDDLRELNRKIVKLGERYQKPVVATCDVHFLNPEDEIYRRIIMKGKGFSDADEQPPLYLHTTEEMLKEFSYLGPEKAEEIVITNPEKIAEMCERISPVRPDKCPPVIEDSDKTLREICYNRAHEIYGEELPPVVTERLERELNSIISNGFAVMYIIAQKLVWKSNDDGYLVGSRGSVGSSFVATMAGITEVNPLRPHYYCEDCHYYDFDSEDVRPFAGRAGCDMPDKVCPNCGAPLRKEGFDIPFETFLGFKGNKEPDIDLNFSGEYQGNAHRYTEVIFGPGQTFRAGTIGTLADKTAFGYVKNYYQEHGQNKRVCEINRIVEGCVGVRRTTGQHPGGIIVLPHGEEIFSFTPVQHPANDMTTDIVTTHFDYHSIDHNLLKLDILGHDDPTMIRMLEDLTGLDARKIPLDDQGVMSLFNSTEALGVEPEDILGCPLGSLGIPEFGTDFVIQMLQDTKPQSFSDLVRISGLSHGTDVWLGNAQQLILDGKATISTAICTRDDIMTYLINMGMESEKSFTIMESVRKGKGLKDEWVEDMKAHNVPDWYIWSCKKIKYMFPKAHAAAYVMMAYRIAYCKVYYPLAYYAAYFSIRASAFNYELMCLGQERLEANMRDYKKRKDTLTQKEEDTYKDMKSVQEMYARGFEFMPLDLTRAAANRFQIIDGRLMPALSTIDGLGDKAAEAVVEAAKDGPFLSKDDFRQRTKVSKTVIDLMGDLGILGNLPETNQLSLFDF